MTSILGDNEVNSLALWGPGELIRFLGLSRLSVKTPRGAQAFREAPIHFMMSSWLPVRPCSGLVGDDGDGVDCNGGDEGKKFGWGHGCHKSWAKETRRDLQHFARARELSLGFQMDKPGVRCKVKRRCLWSWKSTKAGSHTQYI